ncbi:MAG TPA: M48 family metallopeptidase [Herpetosiphonaceae bacterium]|nr:M48 family metallopeptidase [Herpetosiphonaceae bacterium]
MHSPTTAAIRPCPDCAADVASDPRFVAWCAACGWNVKPHAPEAAGGLTRLYAALGRRSSRNLLAGMQSLSQLQPRLTASSLAAWAIAAVVHLVSLVCLAGGVYFLVAHWPNILAIFFGGLLLLIAWTLRPRLSRLDDGATVLSRAEFPALYALSDSVASAIKARPLDDIVIDDEFNAWYGRFGWRQRRVMGLGLPLWSILSAEERVCLIGHELGHAVNGDVSRGFFIHSAVYSLVTWANILRPDAIWAPHMGWRGLLAIPINLALLGFSHLAWWSALGLLHLLWRDSQRAEYLADYLAAIAGGTQASLSLLDKMHLDSSCELAMQRIALGNAKADMFDALREHVQTIPEIERERLRRVQLLDASRLDATHPPTPYRIQLMRAHPVPGAQVRLTAEQNAAIDQELSRLRGPIQQRITSGFTGRP